jgi:hypothetical protein
MLKFSLTGGFWKPDGEQLAVEALDAQCTGLA